MSRNRNIILCFFLLSGCGLSTGGQDLATVSIDNVSSQYYTNEDHSLQVRLKRNQSYYQGVYSRMLITFEIPIKKPPNISSLPDFSFALRIQEINPGPHTNDSKTQTLAMKDTASNMDPILYTMILTFGDLAHADQFLYPQMISKPKYMVITNLEGEIGNWKYVARYQSIITENINMPINKFLYDIRNVYGGCAVQCGIETAIPFSKSTDTDSNIYSVILWLFDSGSSGVDVDRTNTIIRLDTGYLDKKGFFHTFNPTKSLLADFSVLETYQQYRKRLYEKRQNNEKSLDSADKQDTALSKFFNSIINNKN